METGRQRSPLAPCLGPSAACRSQWQIDPLTRVEIEDAGPQLLLNASRCQLQVSTAYECRWDSQCQRTVQPVANSQLEGYIEDVSGQPDGTGIIHARSEPVALPTQVRLQLGATTHYRVIGGVFRTLPEAGRVLRDRSSPFAYVALLNRYYSEMAQLTVSGLGDVTLDAFASATDLGTGLEYPVPLERDAKSGHVCVCAH
jgi:hypothetical protein